MSTDAKKILAALIVLGWLVYQAYSYGRQVERQACQLSTTSTALADTTHALDTSEQRRADEGATTEARTEASDEQVKSILAMAEQRNAALRTADGLRQQLAATTRRAQDCRPAGDPKAEQQRQAVEALAAVFGACEAEQREMAAAAQGHLIAGQRCEAEYDALNVKAKEGTQP